MKLYLQFGYGMMAHCKELLSRRVGAGVILSPRDSTLGQLKAVAENTRESQGAVLLDPQCYLRDADHHQLTEHAYWKEFKRTTTNSILTGDGATKIVEALHQVNASLGTDMFILPGLMADAVTPDWLTLNRSLATEAVRRISDRPIISTIALSNDAVADEIQIENIVEDAARWNVAGFYLVAQAPKYLVEDVNWVANLLILAAGLKLLGKTVIVGYGNHQLLCLAAANVDVMASGTGLNVRAFDPSKFYIPEEDDVSRRTRWYYCPQAFSEYKVVFLDAAKRTNILNELKPDPSLGSTYADPLFAGAMPSSVNWRDQEAFRHYLTCLNGQAVQTRKASFDETVDNYRAQLETAEACLRRFRGNGVFGGDREFSPIVDINRSALTMLGQARGVHLRRTW